MATVTITISINDEASANQWLQQVQTINEDYSKAMQAASECLTDMKDFAEGTLIDELYEYGTNLLNAAQATFKAIDEISDTVKKILGSVGNFLEGALGALGGTVSKVLG